MSPAHIKRDGGLNDLLDLFVKAVPRVPRKLVRTGELLELMLDVAERRGITTLDRVMLARLVILQLFAPEVYRLGRRAHKMLWTMASWEKDIGEASRKRHFLSERLTAVGDEIASGVRKVRSEKEGEREIKLDVGEIRYLENVEEPLLSLIIHACGNRNGFDPRVIAEGLDPRSLDEKMLIIYFSLVDEASSEFAVSTVDDERMGDRPVAEIDDIKTFIENLLSSREEVWRGALDQQVIQGRVLDNATLQNILRAMGDRGELYLSNTEWLAGLSRHLNSRQLEALDQQMNLVAHQQRRLEQLLRTLNNIDDQSNDVIGDALSAIAEYAEIPRTHEQRQRLAQREQAIVQRLLTIVENGELEPKQRADAGDALARLGDSRFDANQYYLPVRYRGDAEPALGFVKIDGGPFWMGSDQQRDKYAHSNESVDGNAHQVDAVSYDYWIGRYPVTVAQYGAFMADGGYDNDAFWLVGGGLAWKRGERDSQVRDEDLREWLAKRKPEQRNQPMWWDEQRRFGNRPVMGVSWFEVWAYCRWLNEKLRDQGQMWLPEKYNIRLPTEAEWEKAARAGDRRIYPWGGEWDGAKCNSEAAVGRVSAVGMYPQGSNSCGLHDVVGNVWEWTHTVYRNYPYRPGQRDWIERQGSNLLVVRGGSWLYLRRDARCAVRRRFAPGDYTNNLGFRVVLSLAADN